MYCIVRQYSLATLIIITHFFSNYNSKCPKIIFSGSIIPERIGKRQMSGINIVSTGSYAPKLAVTNDDMAKIVETNDEWIRTRTGISQRRMSDGEPTWYMGAMASKQAIERAGIDPKEIGLIISSTITNDFVTPSWVQPARALYIPWTPHTASSLLTITSSMCWYPQTKIFPI